MSNENLTSLLKKQKEERQELVEEAYTDWLPISENEKQLLSEFGGKYENAPQSVQEKIDKAREVYFNEWGADGKLAAIMAERQAKDRERQMRKEEILEKIKETASKQKDQEHGR